jgi:hypothetical protein
MAETRSFELHKQILSDIIKRQAGTLSKGILEGVMNAIDAGAKECRITADARTIKIEDDGRGMQKRQEILDYFEKFGTPHTEEEKKIFGTFRMGRGQLFAHGVNIWRTGPWRMRVDVNKGLEYELTESKKKQKGCVITVELYNELKPSQFGETERTIASWCKYVEVNKTKVFWNGEQISVDPEDEKWTHKLPEAYVLLKQSGQVQVYNLGIHTMNLPASNFGSGGIIVSRQQMKMNFARNDVMDDCLVWSKVKPFFKKKAAAALSRKKTALDENQRQHVAEQILDGEVDWEEISKLKILTLVNGRQVSLHDLAHRLSYQCNEQLTACLPGNVLGDTLLQRKVAIVLSTETLERFNVTSVAKFLDVIRTMPSHRAFDQLKAVDFLELTRDMDQDYLTFREEELTEHEKLWLSVIDSCKNTIFLADELKADGRADWVREDGFAHDRRIMIGEGPARGWTDGSRYVVITRKFLEDQQFNIKGFGRVGRLLLHEFCHGDSSARTHAHTEEFWQLFHDSTDRVFDFIDKAIGNLEKLVKLRERRVTKKMYRELDRVSKAKKVPVVRVAESIRESR